MTNMGIGVWISPSGHVSAMAESHSIIAFLSSRYHIQTLATQPWAHYLGII